MTEHARADCPPQILEWIAWYPDGGLTSAQRGAVEVHAAGCASCRDELAILCERADAVVTPADPDLLFERVLARIEASVLTGAAETPDAAGEPLTGLAAAPRSPRTLAAPPVRAPAPRQRRRSWQQRGSIAAAGLGLVALASAAGWLGRDWVNAAEPGDPGAIYRTATEAASPAVTGVALDVVFRTETSAERINTVLRGLGATIAAGPTELGRYRLALPPGSDARAAAALLRADGTGVASYAEPVQP
jgi:hypothetical protein